MYDWKRSLTASGVRALVPRSALQAGRRVFGRRDVAWPPEFVGFGNLLEAGLWAHTGPRERRGVLVTPVMESWIEAFPKLRKVFLTRSQVSVWDRRVQPWEDADRWISRWWTSEDVDAFVNSCIIADSMLQHERATAKDVDRTAVTINIRRGDYYSDPSIQAQFGFDQLGYLKIAMDVARSTGGPISHAHVVSDDIDWCQQRLPAVVGDTSLTFASNASMVEDFLAVAQSRRLILTNSTFSYWAAHVSNVIHGDNESEVVVPNFFCRRVQEGRPYQLRDGWSVVSDIPAGWDDIGLPSRIM